MRRFYLYQRGKFWYAQIFNPQTGSFLPGRSTKETDHDEAVGVVRDWLKAGSLPPTSNLGRPGKIIKEALAVDTILHALRTTVLSVEDAIRVVEVLKERGLIETAVVKAGPGSILFSEFLTTFWTFDKSPYIIEKTAYGQRVGKRHAYESLNRVKQHWIPYFKDKRLVDVKKAELKAFGLSLAAKKLAPDTINKILTVGTTALKWAKDNEMIPVNPAEGLMRFSGNSEERGVLTENEAQKVFSVPWENDRGRVGNLLAMTTGLRAGEVLAVQVRDIEENCLQIRHSWSCKDGLKAPKSDKARTVPLVPSVRLELLNLARKNPHGFTDDSFVFFSLLKDKPMDIHFLQDTLKEALIRSVLTVEELKDPIKINETVEYWKKRNVVFHSWRHYFATKMAGLIGERTMLLTGHASAEVFKQYSDHAGKKEFDLVSAAVLDAFSGVSPFVQEN